LLQVTLLVAQRGALETGSILEDHLIRMTKQSSGWLPHMVLDGSSDVMLKLLDVLSGGGHMTARNFVTL
jgi:hypothetical protein